MSKKLCILDFVGTLYNGSSLFEDASKFCSSIKSKGYEIIIYSNSSLLTKQTIFDNLHKSNINSIDNDHIYTISSLTISQLKKDNVHKLFCICSDLFKEELIKEGFDVYRSEDHKQDSISEVPLIDGIEAVVVGTDPKFNFTKAALGTRYVIEKKAKFYSIGGDRRFFENSHYYPGSCSLSMSIQSPTSVDPIIIGKPDVETFKQVFDYTVYDDILVVGDNIETDIEFAKRIGAKSALVLTGVTNKKDNLSGIEIVCNNLEEVLNAVFK